MTHERDEALLRAMGAEVVRMIRRRVVAPIGAILEQSTFRILRVLVDDGPTPMSELVENLQLDQSTVSRQVKVGVEHGFISREIRPGVRGQVLVGTEAGVAAYRHDWELRSQTFAELVKHVGHDRVVDMVRALADLNDAMDRAEKIDAGRRGGSGPPSGR